ncbi:MAG: alanine racemase [Campylobacterota bacterium]|nr:alanine racemase [Campylobacterota bacterium]
MAYITLNKNNFFHNLSIIESKTKDKNKIAIVLKDNAYGHGIVEIATMAKEYGIKKAVVRCEVEAKMVEDFFDYILVLSEIPTTSSDKIRYTISNIENISKFPKNTKVELKVDTGMHRNAISKNQLTDAIKKIEENGLILEAIFTHHRSADELTSEWFWQNDNFKQIKKEFKYLKNIKFHSANSASILRTTDFDEDMVRVGISAYGCMDSFEVNNENILKPVLSLYALKNSTTNLKKGDRLGYSATYEMPSDAVVSNYDFGYGDGFLRICSNNYKTPDGNEQIGRISMDNSSFLSDKEELLIFNDARVIAKQAKTISYEILTSLKPYIKRIIV